MQFDILLTRIVSSVLTAPSGQLAAANHHVPWRAGSAWLGGVGQERGKRLRLRRPRGEQFETLLSGDMKRNVAWDIHIQYMYSSTTSEVDAAI